MEKKEGRRGERWRRGERVPGVRADDLCVHMVINGPEWGKEAKVLADKAEAEEEGMSGSQS